MPNSETVLQVLLCCQLLTISMVASIRWCSHQWKLFKRYPEKKYPLFYVFSQKTEQVHLVVRLTLDFAAISLAVGIIFFKLLPFLALKPFILWAVVSSIQLVPSLYSLQVLRLATKRRKQQKRMVPVKISVEPRSIVDYLPLTSIGLLVLSVLITLNVIFSNESLETSKKLGLITLFLGTCFLLSKAIFQTIYGKKYDKFIDESDRTKKRTQDVQQSIFGLISCVFIFALLGMQGATNSNANWLLPLLSVFIQVAIISRSSRWYPEDMEVYATSNETISIEK